MFTRTTPDGLTKLAPKVVSLAAAGTDQATAAAIDVTKDLTTLTGANGTAGASLPAVVSPRDVGAQVIIHNSGSAVAKVFPESGGTINGAAANAAVSLAATSFGVFICTGAATWKAFEAPAA